MLTINFELKNILNNIFDVVCVNIMVISFVIIICANSNEVHYKTQWRTTEGNNPHLCSRAIKLSRIQPFRGNKTKQFCNFPQKINLRLGFCFHTLQIHYIQPKIFRFLITLCHRKIFILANCFSSFSPSDKNQYFYMMVATRNIQLNHKMNEQQLQDSKHPQEHPT